MSILEAACEARDAISAYEDAQEDLRSAVLRKFPAGATVDVDIDCGISVTIQGLKFCFDEDFYSDKNITPTDAEQEILEVLNA